MLKFASELHLLVAHHHTSCFTFIEAAAFKGVDHSTHLLILISERVIPLLELPHECLEMEPISISRVLALSDSHQFFDLIHLGK